MLVSRVISWWNSMCSGDSELVSGGKLFSRMVYLWMLFLFLFLSPLLHDVIGPKGLTYRTAYTPGILNNLVYILSYKPVLYKSIWAFNAAGIILCFFNLGNGKRAFSRKFWVLNTAINVLPKVIVWITGIILFSSTYFLFNAGVYLATNWLFWLIFYTPNPDSDWRIALNNWAVLAARIQFLIVYVYSAVYKWIEPDWINGDSIHFLSLLKQFTPEWLSHVYQSAPWFTTFLTYLMLAYLTLFPVLIWWKKAKNILLTIGIGFHLYSMFIMKLYDFGLIMIIGYILFLSKGQVEWLHSKLGLFSFKKVRK